MGIKTQAATHFKGEEMDVSVRRGTAEGQSEYFLLDFGAPGHCPEARLFVDRHQLRQIKDEIGEFLDALIVSESPAPEAAAASLEFKRKFLAFTVEPSLATLSLLQVAAVAVLAHQPERHAEAHLAAQDEKIEAAVHNVEVTGWNSALGVPTGNVTLLCPEHGKFSYENAPLPLIGGRCPKCGVWVNSEARELAVG